MHTHDLLTPYRISEHTQQEVACNEMLYLATRYVWPLKATVFTTSVSQQQQLLLHLEVLVQGNA